MVDRSEKGKIKASTTLKDLNFLQCIGKLHGLTKLERKDRIVLRIALKRDVEFLRSKRLMDYSLLVAI